MKINLKKAVKTFYSNPSFEQIYLEAFANAIDAGANKVSIVVEIDAYEKPDTLQITITDNGCGFTDENFRKFSQLLEADGNDHKGLGRLVYLAYFNEVTIESFFEEKRRRLFTFNGSFTGESQVSDLLRHSGTSLRFRHFSGVKIKTYDYLTPAGIKSSILLHFFPLLFQLQQSKKSLDVSITLEVKEANPEQEFISGNEVLTINDLPIFERASVRDSALDFFQTIDIHYYVKKNLHEGRSISTSICVDGRAIAWDLVPVEAIPNGYQLMFLFISEYFIGKTNSSRQKLELPDEVTEKNLKTVLRKEVGQIVRAAIPTVVTENLKTEKELDDKFPHLAGYYPKDVPGLIIKNVALDEAQKSFFQEQKKLLECETVDDARYEKALELSARALMEYVLYRARIIEKLKKIKPESSETDIHRIIVPTKRSFEGSDLIDDVFNNNVWMLDDKYMSYDVVLSDKSMSDIVQQLTLDDIQDESRPDITIVFSANPDISEKVSVVVIELKKHNVALAKKEEVVSQLRQRARKLLKYYPNKIERIWFYGITDIDQEFRRSLKEDQYKELFSHGQVFYKPQPIIVDDEEKPFLVDLFIMTFDAFIHDAESRNSTFINILRSRIASFVKEPQYAGMLVGLE